MDASFTSAFPQASKKNAAVAHGTGMFFLGQFRAPLVAVWLYKPLGGLANVLVAFGIVAAVMLLVAAFSARGAENLKQEH